MAESFDINKVAGERVKAIRTRRQIWGRCAAGRYLGEEFYNQECDEHQRSQFFALFELVGPTGRIRNEQSFRYPLKGRGNLGEFKIFKKRLFFFRSENDYVVTHGATKKTDKTDPNELERAARIMDEIRSQEQAAAEHKVTDVRQKRGGSR